MFDLNEWLEVGYPSQAVPELMPYADEEDRPTRTVYAKVPVDLVETIITAHGGIKEEN